MSKVVEQIRRSRFGRVPSVEEGVRNSKHEENCSVEYVANWCTNLLFSAYIRSTAGCTQIFNALSKLYVLVIQ